MLDKPSGAGSVNPQDLETRRDATDKASIVAVPEADDDDEFAGIDIDLAMLLHHSKPLFQSRNPAVVLATSIMYYHLAPLSPKSIGQESLVSPLLKLAAMSGAEPHLEETALMTWSVIATMVEERPVSARMSHYWAVRLGSLHIWFQWLFQNRFTAFYLHSSESPNVRVAKLRAMPRLVTSRNVNSLLRECKVSLLTHCGRWRLTCTGKLYIRYPESEVAEEAVRAIGSCITKHPEAVQAGLHILMRLLNSPRGMLRSEHPSEDRAERSLAQMHWLRKP